MLSQACPLTNNPKLMTSDFDIKREMPTQLCPVLIAFCTDFGVYTVVLTSKSIVSNIFSTRF